MRGCRNRCTSSLAGVIRQRTGWHPYGQHRVGWSVAISGPDNDSLIQAIAIELATAQWADQIDLVLVEFGEEIEGLERVSHAVSVSTVSARMKTQGPERGALLASVDLVTNSRESMARRWTRGTLASSSVRPTHLRTS